MGRRARRGRSPGAPAPSRRLPRRERTPASPAEPPEPPPVTMGTPAPGSHGGVGHTPDHGGGAPAGGGVVRAAGAIGLKYTLEGIEVRGNTTTLARVVLRYVPFQAGDVLDVNDPELELTRFRLLGTGFFRDVQLSLRRGTQRGYVVLVVDVSERNTLVVDDLWLGLSADVDPSGSEPAAHGVRRRLGHRDEPRPAPGSPSAARSPWPTASSRCARGSSTRSSPARTGSPRRSSSTTTRATSSAWRTCSSAIRSPRRTSPILQYKRFGARVGFGHDLGISSQIFFDYRLEKIDAALPAAASDHRGLDVEPIDFMLIGGSSILSTLRTTVVHDTRDEPILPTRGHFLTASVDASLTPLGSDYPYAKLVAHGSQWFELPWGHVLGLDAFVGAHLRQRARSSSASTSAISPTSSPIASSISTSTGGPPRTTSIRTSSRSATATTPRSSTRSTACRSTAARARSTASTSSGASASSGSRTKRTSRPRAGLPGLRHGAHRPDVQRRPADRHPGGRLRHRPVEPRRPHPGARRPTRGRRGR